MTNNLPLNELRALWTQLWGIAPHKGIGPTLLQKSIDYQLRERDGGGLRADQRARLDQLVKQYKRNPKCFDERCNALKPGTRLIRKWKGKQHSVLVKVDGFDYDDRHYTSLSQIANDITGTRWNGHTFFKLKNLAR